MRIFLFALGLAAACGGSPAPAPHVAPVIDEPSVEPEPGPASLGEPPLGQLPESVTPTRYELALTIVPDQQRFSGTVAIHLRLDEPARMLWLHGQDLQVSLVTLTPAGGEPLTGQWHDVADEGIAAVSFDQDAPAGEATLTMTFDAAFDRQLTGLYRIEAGGDAYAFTQFEAISARKAFPCFDEPRFKTPYDVTLTIKQEHVAAANTRAVDEQSLAEEMKRIRYATTEALPTYLLAWAVGPLDIVEASPIEPNSVRRRPLPFRGIAVRGQGARLRYALERTPAILAALEQYFGTEYPYDKLDIVAVPDFAAGAMENVGLVTFRDWLLLMDEQASSERQRRGFAYVMAHELAHMWFGNLVTMPWWDDIWLNEAFATWMEMKIVRSLYPEFHASTSFVVEVQHAMGSDSLVGARSIRQPIASNHDIRNAFDSITYSKGGGVLEMFERWMGEETFQQGIRRHMAQHRFGTATSEDLLVSLTTAAGRDVATPFRTFISQPGVPFVQVSIDCSGEQNQLRLRQSRYLPVGSTGDANQTWQVPMCVRYRVGRETKRTCTLLTEAEGTMPLEGSRCPSWVMPNADGAGYYRFGMDDAAMTALRRRGFRRLSDSERVALADSLRASFANASSTASSVLSALEPFARSESRHLASVPAGLLRFIRSHVADDALRPRVDAHAARLYHGAQRRLGWTARRRDDGETRLRRQQLTDFMALTIGHAGVRRRAVRLAHRFLGYGRDGELHPGVLQPSLVETAVSVAVQEGDARFFDAVLERLLASNDSALRRRLLVALGHATEPALATRARALSLDERLRSNEAMTTLQVQMASRETREATWQWITENFEMLTGRISSWRAGYMPTLASNFCDEPHARAVQAFFASQIEDLPGGPRNLATAVERIRLCAARVQAHRESVERYFTRHRR